MSNFRESLIDRMIRLYGFEDKKVIDFAKMCETWPETDRWNKSLAVLVKSHEDNPIFEEE
jgi:hypothetical protein